jgi:hypothetical protein
MSQKQSGDCIADAYPRRRPAVTESLNSGGTDGIAKKCDVSDARQVRIPFIFRDFFQDRNTSIRNTHL